MEKLTDGRNSWMDGRIRFLNWYKWIGRQIDGFID